MNGTACVRSEPRTPLKTTSFLLADRWVPTFAGMTTECVARLSPATRFRRQKLRGDDNVGVCGTIAAYKDAVIPPSTYSVCPFTKLAASLVRKTQAPTNSSTLPQRPAGVRFSSQAQKSGSSTSALLSGVSK